MTLTDVLLGAATRAADQGVIHIGDTGTERLVTYAELATDALRIAGGLRAAGLNAGDKLLVVADDSADFLSLFWGAICAGIVPVPLPPEPARLTAVARLLGEPPLAGNAVLEGTRALSPASLRQSAPLAAPAPVTPDDLALLQFSSGSTGAPKGVELTHRNLTANLAQAAQASALDADDIVMTWMPYFHDMGLIGTHLVPTHIGCRQVRISPLTFAKRPETWLRTAQKHQATVLSAANFALALTVRRVPGPVLDEIDLSRVRLVMVGAEPISPTVWRAFADHLTRARLDPRALCPVYGLAEASVAVTFAPVGELAQPVRLSRAALSRGVAVSVPGMGSSSASSSDMASPEASPSGLSSLEDASRSGCSSLDVLSPSAGSLWAASPSALPSEVSSPGMASPSAPPSEFSSPGVSSPSAPPSEVSPPRWASPSGVQAPVVELMDVGYPVPGCRIRVVDEDGQPVEDGLVGHIQVQGANVTRGYHLDPAATAAVRDGEWLRTGDMGFLRAGRLCVTGREKDVVFVHGRTFHAADLEEVAAGTPGLGPGPVAVVGSTGQASGRERVVVFLGATAVRTDPAVPVRVRARVAEALGYDGVEVRVEPNGVFARTTSGKLRRKALRDRLATAAAPPPPQPEPFAPPTEPVQPQTESSRSELSPGMEVPVTRSDMELTVRAAWAQVLRIPSESIGPDDRFLAIGGSSLSAMQVLAVLEDALGRTLDPVLLRDCATVSDLADRLLTLPPVLPPPAFSPRSVTELAVIGMACRFPDADTPEQFWRNLVDGRDSVTPVTRWPGGGHGAFLEDPALFDAEFFGIDRTEADCLDPHARIFLALAHEALERAGYAGPRRRGRRIGVFAAVGESGYPELVAAAGAAGPHAMTGTMRSLLPARVAHLLDLHGPALAVDTACSSALVALHLAHRSLAAGDCDMAVVGGVTLHLTPTGERLLGSAQALSPSGRCRAFAADADGFVPGEGGAALILTRLPDATDDHILAVVRGTAVNNDGRSLSLMAPNPQSQREVIAQAYRDSGVDPAAVSYVEAHGTGTEVGDPVEAQSLAYAFPPLPDGRKRLLGSVKTNIGHLLHAAGLPSLIKVILALRHRELPPSLHHVRPSPRFDLSAAGFEVVTSRLPWTRSPVAGINSFGFGGTNAHVILAAPPPQRALSTATTATTATTAPEILHRFLNDGPRLLTLSARSADALRAVAGDLAEHLRTHPGLREADVCATASTARDDGPHRTALIVDDDLIDQLVAVTTAPRSEAVGRLPRVAFLFGGQGTQRPGQGAALYESAPRFRTVLDELSAAAGPIAGRTLVEWCTDPAIPAEDLARTEVTQPLVVAFGIAQAAQLRAYGINPEAVAGHSIGEFAAGAIAGLLSANEAVRLAAARGRLTATLAGPGAMLAVAAGADEISGVLNAELAEFADVAKRPDLSRTAIRKRNSGAKEDGVSPRSSPAGTSGEGGMLDVVVAADNAPDQVVLAGPSDAIENAAARLAAHGLRIRPLAVSHAFHSPAMVPVAAALGRLAPTVRTAAVPLISTVTGEWGAAYDAAYLTEHAVRPVRFAAAMNRLQEAGFDTFVEMGAGTALAPLVRQATVRQAGGDARELLMTAGELWQRGAPLDRSLLDSDTRRVEVPTYPFQRQRYWVAGLPNSNESPKPTPLPYMAPTIPQAVPRPGRTTSRGTDAPVELSIAEWVEDPTTPSEVHHTETPVRMATVAAVTVLIAGPQQATPGPAEQERTDLPQTRLAPPTAAHTDDLVQPDLAAHVLPGRDSAHPGPVQTGACTPAPSSDPGLRTGLDAIDAVCAAAAAALTTAPRTGHLLVVTRDLYVTGRSAERPDPAHAVWAGLSMALADESPGLGVRIVDLSSADSEEVRQTALDRELALPPAPGPAEVVAWREGLRLTRRFVPPLAPALSEQPSRAARDQPAELLSGPVTGGWEPPPNGRYLIVGGAGAAGSAIARDLARRGQPYLLLAGRSAEPAELLEELRTLGATVEYRIADVTVESDVSVLVAGREFDVVVHAAGVVRPGSLRAKSAAEIASGLSAKVWGTCLLAQAVRDQKPLILALSSVSSALPGLAGAIGEYVAGNAYLDAFAVAERVAGRRFVAVNLPALTGGGLAENHGLSTNRPHAANQGLSSHRALAADRPVVAAHGLNADPGPVAKHGLAANQGHGTAQVRSLPVDQVPEALWAASAIGSPQVLVTARQQTETNGSTPSTYPSSPFHASIMDAGRRTNPDEVVTILRDLLAGPLHRDPMDIGIDEPFLTLGLDSLTAVDLVKSLEARLGRTLSTTLLFEHRTLGEVSRHLAAPAIGKGGPVPIQTQGFPLSPVQRAFSTTGQLYPGVPAYAYVRQTVTGTVEPERLHRAFAELEQRHPMLRVRLDLDGQRFEAPSAGRLDWFSVTRLAGIDGCGERATGCDSAETHHELREADQDQRTGSDPMDELDAELRNRCFDLSREAPIRALLILARPGLSYLIVVAHHAAVDGYSLAVLGDELWAVYAGLELPAPPSATFAEHERLRDAPAPADLEHWRRALAEYPELSLPFDGDPLAEPEPPYAVHHMRADPALTARLTAQARAGGVSLFHLLLAGYMRCLARWSGQGRVPVLVARAGRTARLPEVDRMVGPFADTLPVLADVRNDEPAIELAQRLRDAWVESETHGTASTLDLARLLRANGAGPRTASPASFSFARFPGMKDTGSQVVATTAGTASAATRLGLVCFEAHGVLHFSWNYPTSLFKPTTIERLAAEHRTELSPALCRAGSNSPQEQPVAERIRRQCQRTPEAIAVLTDGIALTYGELDAASDRLAGRLAATGERRIGLLTGPGAATAIGVVGILKAGAAWVPLDAAHPPTRLSAQLSRAGVSVVVHDDSTGGEAGALKTQTLIGTTDGSGAEPPPVTIQPEDDAYVIFTSGSTGRPKGVVVSHRAMAGYLDWATATFGYRPGDRMAQTASICFDASVRQILAPLLTGATVVAWDRDTVRDPDELLRRVVRDRITVWSSVPTLWEQLLVAAEKRRPDLSALRWVHVGGEELSASHVRRWFDLAGTEQRVSNLYGPTETTINATFHVITERPGDDETHLPIGRPIGGTVTEVIGPDGHPCAPGDVGELFIGGVGVAAGYLDDPEQTAAAFVVRDGQRWYRSGDRAVRDEDGLLWFRGRVDDQVKVHGHRVEPGEVEALLRGHPAVERATVRGDSGRLVAVVQPRGDLTPTGTELRTYLKQVAPSYLVPSRIEVVTALPLTATGKIDRTSLKNAAPVTATERVLAEAWQRMFGVPQVGRDDDFFALGGDSISVLELFSELALRLPVLPRPTVIYRCRTLAALAAAIDEAEATVHGEEVGPGAEFPLSSGQRGYLLADALGFPSAWLAAPRLHGPLDLDRFQRAVDALVVRHPMLRTVFSPEARPPTQRELPRTERLAVGYDPAPGPLADELAAERAHRFDPSRWPLVRLRLLRVTAQEHVLILHAHHLVGDGYSVALLARELLTVYDCGADALPPLRSTFRDYVALLGRLTPTSVANDSGPARAVVTTGCTISPATTNELREQAAGAGVTPFVPVLDAYRRSLAAVFGRSDPTVGVAVTGRDQALPDLGRIFGPCATAVAVCPHGYGLQRTAEAVAEARTGTFTAPHGWRFFFTYLDFDALGTLQGNALRLSWDDTDAELTVPPGTEVLLSVRPVDGGLRLTLRARATPETLDRLATDLRSRLESAARLDAALVGYLPAPEQLAAAVGDLSPKVRAQLPNLDRESIRALLFPDGRPRLLETTDTPLGRSGFVCLPRFADELTGDGLAAQSAAAADLASGLGARSVSLAGMIPALTGYGSAVARLTTSAARVTTGHAVTAASVVHTTLAAMSASGRSLSGSALAVVGVGSIGASFLNLLLARAGQSPARLVLCDLPSAADRLAELASTIKADGYRGRIDIVTADPADPPTRRAPHALNHEAPPAADRTTPPTVEPAALASDQAAPRATSRAAQQPADRTAQQAKYQAAPEAVYRSGPQAVYRPAPAAVYRADVIVAATSGGAGTLDVDRLRPGTVVVDDSFPHCFDPARALVRMREKRDVLVVGGGLLHCGPTDRTVAAGLPPVARTGIPDAMASCQLESLLHATMPGLPLVCGPVDAHSAAAYWDALDAAGVRAAPLHLLDQVVPMP